MLRRVTGELCLPRKTVKMIMQVAHDSPESGHFGTSKTLHHLQRFYWSQKVRDVRRYVYGCDDYQKQKHSNQEPLTAPQVLELPTSRWGSIAMDFIVELAQTKSGFDAIKTYVEGFSNRPQFIPKQR